MSGFTYDELFDQCQQLQRELQYYREYDLLTGVYNRSTFYQKVSALLQQDNEPRAIVCIDVERFKVVNDLYGTQEGDGLLQYLARSLQKEVFSENCVFARLSADVFAACVSSDLPPEAIEGAVLAVFGNAPLEMEIVPAIGIYPISDRKLLVEKMCDRAILALGTIKGNYLAHHAIYDDSLWNNMMQEQEIISRADGALQNNEFEVFMQPKCNMKTGKIVGAEALVRWHHPEKGIISPATFIPVFEKNGFIKKLDAFIWESVAQWLAQWMKEGYRPIPISVNVSRVDIIGMDIYGILQDILGKHRLPSSILELEITESAYTSRMEEIIMTVENLMRSGYTVLMDDFGSGYSSLNMLKDINIDVLKLDLRFLDSTDQKSRDILESIVHMARWLNLRVIAEGVETKSQVDFLMDIGCDYGQGFYYYRPMPLSEFHQLLKNTDMIDYEDRKRFHNIAENMINLRELLHADMMSEQLLNNILGGIALYQFNGKTLEVGRCNQQYYSITHRSELMTDLSGQDVLEQILEADRAELLQTLQEAKTQGDQGAETILRYIGTGGQGAIWLRVRLFYLAESNGKSVYYAAVSDVSGEMNNIEELRFSEQRFRIAMEASSTTLFEVDIARRTARYAKHTQEEFGLDDMEIDAPEGFIQQGSVCPEYIEDFRGIYDAIYRGEDRASCVLQANMGDGSVVWNKVSLIAIQNEFGKNIKAVGLVQNVTREKLLEEQLQSLGK